MSGLALVTGASRGIGLNIAMQLADRGYDILGVGASDRVHTLPDRLPSVHVTCVQADLAASDGVDAVTRAVEESGRDLDVAVLNAGVSLGGAFLDTDLDAEVGS